MEYVNFICIKTQIIISRSFSKQQRNDSCRHWHGMLVTHISYTLAYNQFQYTEIIWCNMPQIPWISHQVMKLLDTASH
jgi:hypothetical protein